MIASHRLIAASSVLVMLLAARLNAQTRGYIIPAPHGQPRVAGIAPPPPPAPQPLSNFAEPGQTVFRRIPALVTPDGRVFVNYGYGYEEVMPSCPYYVSGCQSYGGSAPGYSPPVYVAPSYTPPTYGPPSYPSPGADYPSTGYSRAPAADGAVMPRRTQTGSVGPLQPRRAPAGATPSVPAAAPRQGATSAGFGGARAAAPQGRVLVRQPRG